jgi:hypothetical protein
VLRPEQTAGHSRPTCFGRRAGPEPRAPHRLSRLGCAAIRCRLPWLLPDARHRAVESRSGRSDRHWSSAAGGKEATPAPGQVPQPAGPAKSQRVQAARKRLNHIRGPRQTTAAVSEVKPFTHPRFEHPECAVPARRWRHPYPATISRRLRRRPNMASSRVELIHHGRDRPARRRLDFPAAEPCLGPGCVLGTTRS